jgi:hypothetical protein
VAAYAATRHPNPQVIMMLISELPKIKDRISFLGTRKEYWENSDEEFT